MNEKMVEVVPPIPEEHRATLRLIRERDEARARVEELEEALTALVDAIPDAERRYRSRRFATALDCARAVLAASTGTPEPARCRFCGGAGVWTVGDGDYEGAGVHEEDCPECGGSGEPPTATEES